nr:cytochrome P450 [Rubricella aquisinus]
MERLRRFRGDVFASQPDSLYDAWMAEQRTPFFRSFLVNEPGLLRDVLNAPADEMPKHDLLRSALGPLLGNSVFVSNGPDWARARRIIDPAFQGAGLAALFEPMRGAAEATVARLDSGEMERPMSHLTADAMFRTLFSRPIEDAQAQAVFEAFRAYQRAQPLLSPLDLVRAPRWMPRPRPRGAAEAAKIRALIHEMVTTRAAEIAEGRAPDDLATRLMSTPDPVEGRCFTPAEMVDQIAIFFLAGHETSASALAWAIWLLAAHPEVQARAAAEALALPPRIEMRDLRAAPFLRDVFREVLRLYPPVPMMLRQTARATRWRGRAVPRGAMVILSPWHAHRHRRIWQHPDRFDPDRWQDDAQDSARRGAYYPFSAGPRACPGAGFAMMEGVLTLVLILRRFRLDTLDEQPPEPVAHLTLRARDGIYVALAPRA